MAPDVTNQITNQWSLAMGFRAAAFLQVPPRP
jgi:hypothetical protein